MNRPFKALILSVTLSALTACATTNPSTVATTEAVKGEIVLSEAVQNTNAVGGGAAVAIGSAIVGALVPGPWGGVAQAATGQAGNIAVSGNGGLTRYHVRAADGDIVTYDQANGPSLPAGTKVDIITMSDGSKRVVPNTSES